MRRESRRSLPWLVAAAVLGVCITVVSGGVEGHPKPADHASGGDGQGWATGWDEATSIGLTDESEPRGSLLRVYCGWRGTDYAPFHRWPAGADKPTGFEPELIERVAQLLGQSVVYVEPAPGMQQPRFEMLTQARADVVISTFSITASRRQRVDFSRPYFHDGLGVLVRAGSAYRRPTELAAKRIIVVPHTTGEAWVKKHWPRAVLVRSPYADERTALERGVADGYLNDRSHLVHLATGDSRVRVLPGYLTREPWGIAVAKGNTALRQQINAALAKLESRGQLAALRRRWIDARR